MRLARRIRRDTLERGRDVAGVIEQYAKFVKPAFDDFVLPTKKYADVIIPRGGDNHVSADRLEQGRCVDTWVDPRGRVGTFLEDLSLSTSKDCVVQI